MIDRKKILIEVSNRHAHLSREDIDRLFGKDYLLKSVRELSQPGQFVCNERVDLIGVGGRLEGVRILGPERGESQIEILKSDIEWLDLKDVPVRSSGDLEGSPGLMVVGPFGQIDLKKGVIVSRRHLHVSDEEAEELGISDGEGVSIRVVGGVVGEREFILENIFVRRGEGHKLAVHIDKDEGDEFGLGRVGFGELV